MDRVAAKGQEGVQSVWVAARWTCIEERDIPAKVFVRLVELPPWAKEIDSRMSTGFSQQGGNNLLPTAGGEDVLVAIVPASLDDFACVRLILLDGRIGQHPDIFVHVEVEERS